VTWVDVGTTGFQATTESERLVTYVTFNKLTAYDVTSKHRSALRHCMSRTAVTQAEALVDFTGSSGVCTKQGIDIYFSRDNRENFVLLTV